MGIKTISLYFRDIKRGSALTDEELRELVKRVQAEENRAANKLITSNLRFVSSIAQRYKGRGLPMPELMNEGSIGLLNAARHFDLTAKNVKFISYAAWWIRQSIQNALNEQTTTAVRIPHNIAALVNKFKQALDRNSGDYETTIEMDEFREHEKEIAEAMEVMHTVSLDAPINSGTGGEDGIKTLADIIGNEAVQEDESERKNLAAALRSVLQLISEREAQILQLYYGLNGSDELTLEEISKRLNITREKTRFLRDRTLRKLMTNPILKEKLEKFL
ncbi:MAG: RNA polymerase sigma factor RpoD/SigA [Chitinispirillia bacterium]|nr:RNA polymerase sigma factor RpoD/SigA [Chitinispirillia bacterium]